MLSSSSQHVPTQRVLTWSNLFHSLFFLNIHELSYRHKQSLHVRYRDWVFSVRDLATILSPQLLQYLVLDTLMRPPDQYDHDNLTSPSYFVPPPKPDFPSLDLNVFHICK